METNTTFGYKNTTNNNARALKHSLDTKKTTKEELRLLVDHHLTQP